jgi:hypothetical protein
MFTKHPSISSLFFVGKTPHQWCHSHLNSRSSWEDLPRFGPGANVAGAQDAVAGDAVGGERIQPGPPGPEATQSPFGDVSKPIYWYIGEASLR